MKTVKKIGLGLLVFLAIIVLFSFFLPSAAHVERSVVINGNDSVIFSKVNNLKNFITWMPWGKKDPNTKMEFFGPEAGIGQGYTWKSENREVGAGKMTIVKSAPNELVQMEMEFEGMGKSSATFTFKKENEGTKVTWAMDSNGEGMPALFYVPHKYMSLFMDKMVGPDFESGLAALKSQSEAN